MISCPRCQTLNQAHYRFCLQCGSLLQEATLASGASPSLQRHAAPAPLQTPRRLQGSARALWKLHSFGLLFGGIWFMVGAPVGLVGALLTLSTGPMPGLVLLLVGGIFGGSGALIMLMAVRNIQRKRWLLRYGAQARGRFTEARIDHGHRLNGRPATVLLWAFEDALGQTHKGEISIFDPPPGWQMLPGQPVTILYDPAHPNASLAPSLANLTLASPPLSDDRRRALANAADYVPPRPVTAPLELPLTASLPTPRSAWLGLGGDASGKAGRLRLTPDGLDLLGPDGAPRAQILWARRFTAIGSVFPLPDGAAELGLTLTQGGGPDAQRVRVRALAAQDQLDPQLPLQELAAPWIDKNAYEALRPHLDFYLQAHGERPTQVAAPAEATAR